MLTSIVALLSGLLGFLGPKFGASNSLDQLIEAAFNGVPAIFAGLKSGSAVDAELATLKTALSVAQADTSNDPAVLAQIEEQIRDIEAAIAAYQEASKVDDPSTLTQLPTE